MAMWHLRGAGTGRGEGRSFVLVEWVSPKRGPGDLDTGHWTLDSRGKRLWGARTAPGVWEDDGRMDGHPHPVPEGERRETVRHSLEIRNGRGAEMMLFVVCGACGAVVEEGGVLMLAKHFSWQCPVCHAANPAVNAPGRTEEGVVDDGEDEEDIRDAEAQNAPIVRTLR